ncbi:MAG TPA: signal peptidase I [Longimicrobiales bacterium]|nr:signal peptidase I [Longimicrobiales bacterium]
MDSEVRPGVGAEAEPAECAPPPRRSLVRAAWEWSRSILIALVLFLAIRSMGLEAFKIPTGSMEGTLLVGDFLLVNKAAYGARIPGTDIRLPALAEPERGDVVVFNPPHEPDRNYVKRVVGIPGDTLQMRDKVLLVNGVTREERYARYIDVRGDAVHPDMEWQASHLVASPGRYVPSRDTWGPIVVPEGRYFVLGDNRDNSEDSRYWGFVERERIRGRPWIVYYSAEPVGGEPWRLFRGVRWARLGHVIR